MKQINPRIWLAALLLTMAHPLRAGSDPTSCAAPNGQASAASPPPGTVFPELKQDPGGYWLVDFRHLASFDFEAPAPDAPVKQGSLDGIPANVRTLDGRRVCISGYLLPITDGGESPVQECLIIRSPMVCCFGVAPRANEWVLVKIKAKDMPTTMDVPLNFYGMLHVGQIYEDHTFAGLYLLDGEKASATEGVKQ
ncbi:MAG TPA: DUF3299 domain-containing protein [Opitutaceae bacterium]|jgi:hypothetical protein|nr:DUF3299 domain-containing protein [Opitutaceae bacterium]